jgi:trk system potassium uptake protein TrkH
MSKQNPAKKTVRLNPSIKVLLTFAVLIAVGTILLILPISTKEQGISFIQSIFTSTSAVCVTGLTVLDTGSDFSFFGQIVILLLIQIGGLGFMTLANWFMLSLRRKNGLFEKYNMTEQSFGTNTRISPRILLRKIIIFTITIEAIGTLVLYLRFRAYFPADEAVWLAIFHAISAFCNAGFSLFSNSLMQFNSDITINLTIMILIILGGIGFIVFSEIFDFSVKSLFKKKKKYLSLHTKLVLKISLILTLIGTIIFFIIEIKNIGSEQNIFEQFLSSVFLSVTARTAGFNTIQTAHLTNATLMIVIFLMVIGASPGSTGGGIKTSTFGIILASFISKLRNRTDVEIMNRKIPQGIVSKALATLFAYVTVMLIALVLLELTEMGFVPHETRRGFFLEYVFEVVSALSTVGLSTGLTTKLSPGGLTILTFCMFIGRIGPLFVATSLIGSKKRMGYSLPEEEIMVG